MDRSSCDGEDPFAGILGRSSIAQALRDARASLARPSRPFTPASRSLFREADDPTSSRPSSSYSVDQLRFVRDTFAASPGSGSTVSTRSGLRSQQSDICTTIPEQEEPELPEPELELELDADIASFGAAGELVAEFHRGGGVEEAPEATPAPIDEYEGGAADDLALCMDVPPPGSDESGSDEDAPVAVTGLAPAGPSRPGPQKPRRPPGAVERPRRRPAPKGKGSSSSSSSKAAGEKLCQVLAEMEALDASACGPPGGLGGASPPGSEASPDLAPLAARICDLAADLRREPAPSGLAAQAPRLLRATLALMERKGAGPICLLRLARSVFELLAMAGCSQEVGGQGAAAAYLNVTRALFKLSKDGSNDDHFRDEGLIDALAALLASGEEACSSFDLRVFAVGVLKNITMNEENQRFLMRGSVLPAVLALTKPGILAGTSKEAQLLIQVAALLRNLAEGSSERQQQLIEDGVIADLTRISAMYTSNEELQLNVSRVLHKLSLHDSLCEAFEADLAHLQQVVRCLHSHTGVGPLVVRLAFVLGNLAAKSDRIREMFMFECEGSALLPNLLERYWRQDRTLAQAERGAEVRSNGAEDVEGVLVKLVRLVANVAISPAVGPSLVQQAAVIDPLLDILGCKRMTESEELVLNTTAAVTNLLFYDSPGSLLFETDNKQLLCRLLRPMLLESYNIEALMEAARALGNLSRHPDARRWISELRVDEVLAILLAHDDRDLVFYACGALVNIVADFETGRRLCSGCDLRIKLADLLRDAPAEDDELVLVVVKVLSNLVLDGASAHWPEAELGAVRVGLSRACEVLEGISLQAGLETPAALAARLLASLPLCEAGLNGTGCGGEVIGVAAAAQAPVATAN
mmetsp:Transcript_1959/g.4686  ORF Transcript_1959/g.4686 Transcript_1959/m.4686 type:complete len:868 (+) Transcript_1959:101-2704(+)